MNYLLTALAVMAVLSVVIIVVCLKVIKKKSRKLAVGATLLYLVLAATSYFIDAWLYELQWVAPLYIALFLVVPAAVYFVVAKLGAWFDREEVTEFLQNGSKAAKAPTVPATQKTVAAVTLQKTPMVATPKKASATDTAQKAPTAATQQKTPAVAAAQKTPAASQSRDIIAIENLPITDARATKSESRMPAHRKSAQAKRYRPTHRDTRELVAAPKPAEKLRKIESQPAATKEVTAPMQKVPAATKEVPEPIKKVPAATQAAPVSKKEIPVAIEEVLAAIRETPAPSKVAPTPIKEAPAPVKVAPTPSKETPAPSKEVPVRSKEASTLRKEAPAPIKETTVEREAPKPKQEANKQGHAVTAKPTFAALFQKAEFTKKQGDLLEAARLFEQSARTANTVEEEIQALFDEILCYAGKHENCIVQERASRLLEHYSLDAKKQTKLNIILRLVKT